ncbi:hypothetical protein GCM10009612_63090 [Streptomyces beijiangensis]
MQIDLPAFRVRDDEPHRALIEGLGESGPGKGGQHVPLLLAPVQEIEIAVVPPLIPDEGVDAPAACDPGVGAGTAQYGENGQDVVGGHHDRQVSPDPR